MRRRAKQRGPLSIRLGEREWTWLEEEAGKRTRAAGVPVGPSSIVRALVEKEAGKKEEGRKRLPFEDIWEWRKKHQIDKYGLPPGYFEKLRDRSPGPEPTWLDRLGPD